MRIPFATSQHALIVVLTATTLLVNKVSAITFAECEQQVTDLLASNESVNANGQIIIDGFDVVYHGPLRGFRGDADTRPITLTRDGCNMMCGTTLKYYNIKSCERVLGALSYK